MLAWSGRQCMPRSSNSRVPQARMNPPRLSECWLGSMIQEPATAVSLKCTCLPPSPLRLSFRTHCRLGIGVCRVATLEKLLQQAFDRAFGIEHVVCNAIEDIEPEPEMIDLHVDDLQAAAMVIPKFL